MFPQNCMELGFGVTQELGGFLVVLNILFYNEHDQQIGKQAEAYFKVRFGRIDKCKQKGTGRPVGHFGVHNYNIGQCCLPMCTGKQGAGDTYFKVESKVGPWVLLALYHRGFLEVSLFW